MVQLRVKNIIDEDFQDYKKPSMFIAMCECDWKCLKEENLNISICQNIKLVQQKDIIVSSGVIIDRYINNPITHAVVIGGLEPILQFYEVLCFIDDFRKVCNDDIIIYTGYYPDEIQTEIYQLKKYKNIIIKYGRYKHNQTKKYDNILGVELASYNQYAEKIS